jgi:hypothetical protein
VTKEGDWTRRRTRDTHEYRLLLAAREKGKILFRDPRVPKTEISQNKLGKEFSLLIVIVAVRNSHA